MKYYLKFAEKMKSLLALPHRIGFKLLSLNLFRDIGNTNSKFHLSAEECLLFMINIATVLFQGATRLVHGEFE